MLSWSEGGKIKAWEQYSYALVELLGCSRVSAPEKGLRVHQEVEVTGSQNWPREGVSSFLGNKGLLGLVVTA